MREISLIRWELPKIVQSLALQTNRGSVLKSANRKSASSRAHSAIENPQMPVCQSAYRKSATVMINPQIANLQFSTKYCTTLSQNRKGRLFTRFFIMYKF